jgi:hypothetical protein
MKARILYQLGDIHKTHLHIWPQADHNDHGNLWLKKQLLAISFFDPGRRHDVCSSWNRKRSSAHKEYLPVYMNTKLRHTWPHFVHNGRHTQWPPFSF